MKLQYLGTAAAEGIPAMFCECDVCRKARDLGGKEIRTRSQALVNDELLIDFSPDTNLHLLKYGIRLSTIQNCIITHSHDDHFYPADLKNLKDSYGHLPAGYCFHTFGNEDVKPALEIVIGKVGADRLTYQEVRPYEPFTVLDYRVTALKALHKTEHPFIYVIEQGKTAMLYAHDTGIFPEETFAYLEKSGLKLQLVSLDCTGGATEELSYPTHMGIGWAEYCRNRLQKTGCIDENTVCVLNHFSHNGEKVNDVDFRPLAKARGFETSFDGMTLEFE